MGKGEFFGIGAAGRPEPLARWRLGEKRPRRVRFVIKEVSGQDAGAVSCGLPLNGDPHDKMSSRRLCRRGAQLNYFVKTSLSRYFVVPISLAHVG